MALDMSSMVCQVVRPSLFFVFWVLKPSRWDCRPSKWVHSESVRVSLVLRRRRPVTKRTVLGRTFG